MPGTPRHPAAKARTIVDGLIVAGSLLLIAWVAGLDHLYDSSSEPAAALLLAVVVAAVAVAASTVVVLTRSAPPARPMLTAAAAGMTLLAIGYAAFMLLALSSSTMIGNLVLLAAWLPGWTELILAPRRSAEALEAKPKVPGHFSVLIPSLPFAAAVVAATATAATEDFDGFLIWVCGIVIVLLVMRQILALVENISFWRELEAEAQARAYDAMHDPLTGLPKRAVFNDRLEHSLLQRRELSLGVVFIDLDDFKLINDCFGHQAGDAVLRAVAERLSECLRPGDTVARFGGDEFAILLDDIGDECDAAAAVERMLSALAPPVHADGLDLRITASIGLATSFTTRREAEEMLSGADAAMYAVKRSVAGGYAVFDPPAAVAAPGEISPLPA